MLINTTSPAGQGRGRGSTAPRSRTAGRCAAPGSPPSEPARDSATTAASASWSQGAPSSWAEWSELQWWRRRRVVTRCFFQKNSVAHSHCGGRFQHFGSITVPIVVLFVVTKAAFTPTRPKFKASGRCKVMLGRASKTWFVQLLVFFFK